VIHMPFWKMHGAGNDFILVDDRNLQFPDHNAPAIETLCRRRTGIGSEGFILIQPSTTAHFRMRFFNPDGHEADMCGNGARCVARLAHDLGVAEGTMIIETKAGTLSAQIQGDSVVLSLPEPTGYQSGQLISLPSGESISYTFLNTGVPHAVVLTDNIDSAPVADLGKAIRRHAAFEPDGTNVNFVSVEEMHRIRVRTYERGVEAETMACGTGIVASAVTAAMHTQAAPPISVLAASGDTLIVNFDLKNGTIHNITLTGPTVHVYSAELTLPMMSNGGKGEP